MPYVINGSSARWVDPRENYQLKPGESFGDTPPPRPDPQPVAEPTKSELQAQLLDLQEKIDALKE